MELFNTTDYYIFVRNDKSLWCSKINGTFQVKPGWEIANLYNPLCVGMVYGIIGKFQVHNDLIPKLILIQGKKVIGKLKNHEIYKITKICMLPICPGASVNDLGLDACVKHDPKRCRDASPGGSSKNSPFSLENKPGMSSLAKTWGSFKQTASNSLKNTAIGASAVTQGKWNKPIEKEKIEKRLCDEVIKLFCDSESFYYSYSFDLTNSLIKQTLPSYKIDDILSKRVDENYFWNKFMIQDLVKLGADDWILPVVMGYMEFQNISIESPQFDGHGSVAEKGEMIGDQHYTVGLMSRRSRHRAGTRYKRRGVDDEGYCANYVETEQYVGFSDHQVSFVQVRGSVPIYWSQPGFKYRPPPRIERDEQQTKGAFSLHFNRELSIYGNQVIISLIQQSGKEKIIGDEFLKHILIYDAAKLTYITFDFHEYCRGMRFENVSVLIHKIKSIIKKVGYTWADKHGTICSQEGTFRVNCMDCLDRTNVVQSALSKAVIEMVFSKLGIIAPESGLPKICKEKFQLMWANNGDILSRQYAGTDALKGDYTRTGERKIAGALRDGMNSANRYYLNRFRDTFRQAAMDLMQGIALSDEIWSVERDIGVEDDIPATADHVKQLLEDCKKLLLSDTSVILGAWAVVDADDSEPSDLDMDTILILTNDSYYVAEYDDGTDRITNYQVVLLSNVVTIEFGQEENRLFKQNRPFCVRITYKANGKSGFFHTFRSTNLRFFNNMAVVIKTEEERMESLKAICETFLMALQGVDLTVPFYQRKLERKKSARFQRLYNPLAFVSLEIPTLSISRNSSETQLQALKDAGSKALSNMTSQFAKLSPKNLGNTKSKSQTSMNNVDASTDLSYYQDCVDTQHITVKVSDNSCAVSMTDEGPTNVDRRDSDKGLQLSLDKKNDQVHLKSPGIVISSASHNTLSEVTHPDELSNSVDSENEIFDDNTQASLGSIHLGTVRSRTISKSSEEMDMYKETHSTDKLSLNLKSSQSDNALRNVDSVLHNLASPLATLSKDTVLAPFSVIAKNVKKGVQSMGVNLDHRKQLTPEEAERYIQLKQRKVNCKTQIIEI